MLQHPLCSHRGLFRLIILKLERTQVRWSSVRQQLVKGLKVGNSSAKALIHNMWPTAP